jgi:selenocysteine lyase/cysteine desulfurase
MTKQATSDTPDRSDIFLKLKESTLSALETYSNVHRGSGHNSIVTTHLFEKARDIVLDYLQLNKKKYVLVFCTARRAEILESTLEKDSYEVLSSQELGLCIGVRAMAIKKTKVPHHIHFEVGGGTAKLISQKWVIWASMPDQLEAGTPAIINIVLFAKSLLLMKEYGMPAFEPTNNQTSVHSILYQDELQELSNGPLLAALKTKLIGLNTIVPTRKGMVSFVNLDNGASTPTFTPIWDTFFQTLQQPETIRETLVKEVRSISTRFLGAPSEKYEIIFTSNTTEAINLVAQNIEMNPDKTSQPIVLSTLLEHNSNDLPWRTISDSSLLRLSIDADGFFDTGELERLLKEYNEKQLHGQKRIHLVSVSGASNVLGVCNDLSAISQIVHQYGASLAVDAAQLVAHRAINMEALGIDFLAFSAHKVYAPFGSGVLLARKDLLHFSPEKLHQIHRSGNENAAGVAALGKSLQLLERIGFEDIKKDEQTLTQLVLQEMSKIPGIKIHGIKDPNHPHFERKLGVIAFEVKGKMADEVADQLAIDHGIGVRFGCHCAHILVKRMLKISRGLEQFQRLIQTLIPSINLPGVTRISLGLENNRADIERLIEALQEMRKFSGKKPLFIKSKPEVKEEIKEFTQQAAERVYH